MKNINFEKLLADLIITKRGNVINALEKAGVIINQQEISNSRLYDIVMIELKKPNTALILALGEVIDQTIDLSPIVENIPVEVYSSLFGTKEGGTKIGNFLRSDSGQNILGAGATALSGWLSGLADGSSSTTPTVAAPTGGGGADLTPILLMQQQQQNAAAAEATRRAEAEASSKKTTIIVISVIGGLLVIGGIITAIVVTRSKK